MKCPQEIQELLKTIYNLSSAESQTMYYLCKNKSARATKIAEELEKDRSTIQKYLSKLLTAELIQRERKPGKNKKGRYYEYSIPDKNKLKEKIKTKMKEWKKEKIERLEKI